MAADAFLSGFFSCDSNLDLKSNLPRLGAWLIALTSFLFWKILGIVLEYWKLLKLCFILEKMFGLFGLHVVVKGIISPFLVGFGCLKTSRGISWAFNMLASISFSQYFCSSNTFFSSLKPFSLTFSFSTIVYILLARQNGIFVKQCPGWFDVNRIYRFESFGLW